jgi:hypothetical protein
MNEGDDALLERMLDQDSTENPSKGGSGSIYKSRTGLRLESEDLTAGRESMIHNLEEDTQAFDAGVERE